MDLITTDSLRKLLNWLRSDIAKELEHFHRNACYPNALEPEIQAAVTRILKIINTALENDQ